jgi:hypothetical protein
LRHDPTERRLVGRDRLPGAALPSQPTLAHVEKRIKELHNGIRMDRLSGTRFLANRARLLLGAAAFGIYQALRRGAAGSSLARAKMTTLRERLIQLAGRFEHAKRHLVLHLPQEAAWRHGWARIAGPPIRQERANTPTPKPSPATVPERMHEARQAYRPISVI